MKLAKDTSVGARSVQVNCVVCDKRGWLINFWADTEGKAFKDYYCDSCAEYLKAPRYIDGELVE